jgi:hypothetical protein
MANTINVKQLQRELKKPIHDPRMALIQQKMGQMYDPQQTESKETRWDYATLYYPRDRKDGGPSEEEGRELKSIGMDGWLLMGFQIYSIPNSDGSQIVAEYVFGKSV